MDAKTLGYMLMGIVDPDLVRRKCEEEEFIVKQQVIGATKEQATELFTLIAKAATASLAPNHAFVSDVLPRVLMMWRRGDTFEQIREWCQALPGELMQQHFVERAAEFIPMEQPWPGGPGRRLT